MAERRSALVVATDRYESAELSQLAAPAADAEALAEVLGDPALGGFDVEVLHNASSSTIEQRIEEVLQGRLPSDLVLLHFSCHGLKDESGGFFLAATNTRPTLLVSTAVEAAIVSRLIRRSRAARVVLLLDCCYGGAFARGALHRAGGSVDVGGQFAQDDLGGGRGRAVITASSAMEYAFEGTRLADASSIEPSVFTGALVEGIRTGAADRDQDGYVSLSELYDFVFDRVRASTSHQTPCKWEFDLQGEPNIARNPWRRVQPGSLPEEVRSLLDSPVTASRLGAVAELVHLTGSTDLPLAAAAYSALRELSEDDSRRVSLAAHEGVARCALTLPEGPLDLGRAEVGGSPLHAELSVRTTPLALTSTVTTTGSPLRTELEDGVLRITAPTSEPGPIAAQVAVTGPAGEVTIEVVGAVAAGATKGRPVDPDRRPGPRGQESAPPLGVPRRWHTPVAVAVALVLAATIGVLTGRGEDGAGKDGAGEDGAGKVEAGEVLREVVTVDGTTPLTDTGVDLTEGQSVTITASGEVFHNEEASTGPEGFPNRPDLLTPVPSQNHNALLGRVGDDGTPFLVGTAVTFTADTSGRLVLVLNDGGLENNRGSFEAVVAVDAD